MPRSTSLLRAIMPEGEPADVSKIEIEILDDGRCRWSILDGGRRIYSVIAPPADQPALIECTRIIVATMTSAHLHKAATQAMKTTARG